MAEPNQDREEESLKAPERLVDALKHTQNKQIFVPPAVDSAVLLGAREHLRRLEPPQSRWKPRLSWAAMAACLALAIWLGERFSNPARPRPLAREDINRDGRVDVLDAFDLARRIETGGTLDARWDINGDGRVDQTDVNAIAARAVSLAQAQPEPKRSADLRQHPEGTHAVWRTEVSAAKVLPASCPQVFGARRIAELYSISIRPNRRRLSRFCGARLGEQLCSARKRLPGFCLSLPARNEWGESRREGKLISSASSPRPSPPFLRRRGRENAVARSKQIYSRTQLLCEPQHVDGLIVLNLPRASCLAKLLRVTDSRSGAWLCEPQHVRKRTCQIFATPAILRDRCASQRRAPQRRSVSLWWLCQNATEACWHHACKPMEGHS